MADLLEWAERFVATPSESRLGNGAIADCAAELLRALKLPAALETVDVAGTRHHLVMCDLPAYHGPGLLLVTHLDTVPPGDPAAWLATGGDPFRPTRDGDKLYGLGSADAKVDFVCKAFALAEVADELDRPVLLAGTFGEEVGMLGARWLVEAGITQDFSQAIVGEPSELAIVHAHKGYAVYEARVRLEPLPETEPLRTTTRSIEGLAAHSSAPELGRNAIVEALAALEWSGAPGVTALAGGGAVNVVPERCELGLARPGAEGAESDGPVWSAKPLVAFLGAWRELQASLESRRDSRFSPAQSVASLGRVSLADGCAVFGFDVRPIPGDEASWLVGPLGRVAELRAVRANPPLAAPADGALVRALVAAQREVGLAEKVETKATCTEAGIFGAAGLEAVVLGPGRSVGNVHKPNEHTRISQLHQAVALYRTALLRLARTGKPEGA